MSSPRASLLSLTLPTSPSLPHPLNTPSRSRSPTPPRRPKRRPTGFDVPPAGETGVRLPGGGLGVLPSTLGGATDASGAGIPGAPAGGTGTAPVSLQATRHARRVYVGGLPDVTSDVAVGAFFSRALVAVEGAVADAPGEPVLNVYLNQEKKFAFIEFRSVEECSNALALDGVLMESAPLRVRRPNDYNAGAAAGLGPSQPSPTLNLAAVGLVANANAGGAAGGSRQPAVPPEDLPNRLFIGGLPYFLNEAMVKELVEAFGPTKSFMLVTDRETGNSKGYGFFVYQDQSVTDVAMQGLHGMQMGEKTLTVRRATGERRDGFGAGPGAGAGAATTNVPPPPPGIVPQPLDPASLQAQAMAHLAGGAAAAAAAATGAPPPPPPPSASNPPSAVVSLGGMLDAEELRDDGEFADIEEDMREELGKFGALVEMVIPRPGAAGVPVPGLGRVFARFADEAGATAARTALHGRKFGGRTVAADFIDVDAFERRAF